MKELTVEEIWKVWKKLYHLNTGDIDYFVLSKALVEVFGIQYSPGLYEYPEWLKEDLKKREDLKRSKM